MGRQLPAKQTQEAIKDLVRHMLLSNVIDGFAVAREKNVLGMVFLPVLYGALSGYDRDQIDQIAVFAILGLDATIGMAYNGWPMFLECRVWHKEDWWTAVELCQKAKAAQESALEG